MELSKESMTLDDLANALKKEGDMDWDSYLSLAQQRPSYNPPNGGLLSRLRNRSGTGELYLNARLSVKGADVRFKYWFDESVSDIVVEGNPVDNYLADYQQTAEQMAEDNHVQHDNGVYRAMAAPDEQSVRAALKGVRAAGNELGLMLSFMQYQEQRELAGWARGC